MIYIILLFLQMDLIFWGVIIGVIVLVLTLKLSIYPRQAMKWQIDQFEKRGYKVKALPFSLLTPPITQILKGTKDDSLSYVKENYPNYDAVIFNNSTNIVIDLCNSQLAKQLVQAESKGDFIKSQGFVATIHRVIGKDSLLFIEGERWKKRRRILNEVFNFDFLKSITPNIAEIADVSLIQLEEQSRVQNSENCFQYNIIEQTLTLASNAAVELFFGKNLRNEKIQNTKIGLYLSKMIQSASLQGRSIFCTIFGVKFLDLGLRKQDRELNRKIKIFEEWGKKFLEDRINFVTKQIKQGKKNNKDHKNLIEALVYFKQKDENVNLTSEELFSEFKTFYLAAVDTTSHFLGTTILLTVFHPEVESKVRQEIQQFMKEDDFSYQNLKRFTYIDKVQKEVTRYYGPSPGIFGRYAVNDTYIKDIPVKKNTRVRYLFPSFHYNEEYYKNPQEFRPERWDEEESKNIPAFALNGFNQGPRTCIGKHFAKLQSKIGLIKFFKKYKKVELQFDKMTYSIGFIYRPNKSLAKVYTH